MTGRLTIRFATVADLALVLRLIRGLAEYERLAEEAVVTEADVRRSLFGEHPQAEVLIAEIDGDPAGFALFFHNYSTFLGRRGLYLEDLFVLPSHRGRGIGRALMSEARAPGDGERVWAFRVVGPRLESIRDPLL